VKEGENFAAQQRKRGLSHEDRNSLWQWAPGAANSAARKQTWGGDYTRAEQQRGIQNIVTGLRRQLVEPPEEEGDEGVDDDEEEEYEATDDDEDEDEDAMDIDKQKPKVEAKSTTELPTMATSAGQMPLTGIHKLMTTGI
jgi:mediator of RNA polymerase II transcription subunit 8